MPFCQITQAERYPAQSAAVLSAVGRRDRPTSWAPPEYHPPRAGSEPEGPGSLRVVSRGSAGGGPPESLPRNQRLTAAHWALVRPYLATGWSPEQIADRWQIRGRRWISHEAVYQYLYRDRTAGGQLYQWLPQGRKTRRRRFGRKRLGGPRGRSITERPAIVARRRQVGHWEIDTIQGSTRACLVTAVERATGYAVIGKLEACTTDALVARLTPLLRDQAHPVRTITADNGPEMTGYGYLERALGTRVYFTQPYSAWQRGSIEHLNGLIRRVYPKGTDFTEVTQLDCTRLARQLNQRPRRRLGFRTPEECYGL